MALSKNELKDIRTTIEWLIKNTKLVENNRTNLETLYNTTTNSICTIDRAIGECSNENSGLHKHFVSGSLPLQTKLEMFYDFLFDNGLANSFNGGIDEVARQFIQNRLEGNDR